MNDARQTEMRVLLVDDEPDHIELYRYGLEQAGLEMFAATDGASALALAIELQPDIIVLDLRMPDMDGWDVCARLKANPRTARIPVVILTAAASPTLARDAARAGCAAHLLKPCYPNDLVRTLRDVIVAA